MRDSRFSEEPISAILPVSVVSVTMWNADPIDLPLQIGGRSSLSLSRRIRALERRLGFALFERTPRDMCITAAGVVFMQSNQDLIGRLRRSAENTQPVANG